jgi:RNA polymerase sigma factor for flagellar operon FliA
MKAAPPILTPSQPPTEERVSSTVWRAYQANNHGTDDTTLIEFYLPLVRKVVERLKMTLPAHVDADDLHSVGVTGLMAAVKKYNPAQHNTFAAYATMRIQGAVLDELRRLDWFSRRARAKARRIKGALTELAQRFGRQPTDTELADYLELSPKEFQRWMTDVQPITFVAIDECGADNWEENGASRHESIPDEQAVSVQSLMEKDELRQLVAERMENLPDIQKRVLAMYYFENMRLAEIAAVFDRTESRICQIHSKAILTLRAQLQAARAA